MRSGIFTLALQCLSIRWLEVLTARRLHVDHVARGATWVGRAESTVGIGWRNCLAVVHCSGVHRCGVRVCDDGMSR